MRPVTRTHPTRTCPVDRPRSWPSRAAATLARPFTGYLSRQAAHVAGVDVSPAMLATAARRNAELFAAGRIDLHLGDGTTVPLPDGSVDAVLAVHTIYFWPDPTATLAEVARVLRPGGRLVLAFRGGEHPRPRRLDPDVYRIPTTEQAIGWLRTVGFTDVQTHSRPDIAPTVAFLTATAAGSRQ